MSISKRLRYEVLRRDNNTCRYCGASAPEVKIAIDHVVPKSLGGLDVAENLVAACVDCNTGKSSSQPDAAFVKQVEEDAFQWKAAVKDSLRREVKDYPAVLAALAQFEEVWDGYTYGEGGPSVPRDSAWRKTVKTWLSMLTQGDLEDPEFVDLASQVLLDLIPSIMSRKGIDDRWRYYCGAAWNKVREMQGKLDVPEPPEPIAQSEPDEVELEVDHRLRFDGDQYSCACGRWNCVLLDELIVRQENNNRSWEYEHQNNYDHEVVDDDGWTYCICPDPYCSHLYAYRLRKGLL